MVKRSNAYLRGGFGHEHPETAAYLNWPHCIACEIPLSEQVLVARKKVNLFPCIESPSAA